MADSTLEDDSKLYAKSKYLFYTCWETVGSHGGIIAGSLIHKEFAQTKEEAEEILSRIKERCESSPYRDPRTKSRYVYIDNRTEWWENHQKLTHATGEGRVE
jgi:hypothetical protein